VNIRDLCTYTDIPVLWEIFSQCVLLSSLDSNGFFTLSIVGSYLIDYPNELPVTHSEFWDAMRYFLYRRNKKVLQMRKKTKGKSDGR
jgi:hypothetical protein